MGCLTPTQFGVLAQLSIHPGLIQSELARRNLVRPQSVDELIRSLIDRRTSSSTRISSPRPNHFRQCTVSPE